MGGARPLARGLNIAALMGSALLLIGAVGNKVLINAERWLAPGTRVSALSARPRECLAVPSNARDAAMIAVGRAAFRDPLLLGGQGARSRMSCATCHINGRSNPAFFLAEISDRPGTADVTNSVMSSHRSNGVFDPRPIPDLTTPGKISRDTANPALATFVRGLITEEFDGLPPPRVAFDGLLAYLRAIRRCDGDPVEPITVDAAIADTNAAMRAAATAPSLGDRPAARLLIGGARMTLADIDERYDRPGLDSDGVALKQIDGRLLALQLNLDRGQDIAAALNAWRFPPSLQTRLQRDAARSLYDPALLKRSISETAIIPS